jgi:hypothetical protein
MHNIARVQRPLAVMTRGGDEVNGRVHVLSGHQRPRVAGMARLAARHAAALPTPAPDALPTGKSIGRRWFRGRCRILLPEGELSLEFSDALGLFSKLSLALGQLSAQALILLFQPLLGVLGPSSLRPRHASHGTPIRSPCTAP